MTEEQKIKLHQLREEENRKYEQFKSQMIEYILSVGEFSQKQAEMIFERAWEDGHAYGYNEVQRYVESLAEWLSDFKNAI